MDKVKIGEQLKLISGKQVTVKDNVKYSEKKSRVHAGRSGYLKLFSLGDLNESPIVLIELSVIIKGKKADREEKVEIWMDARDIVGVEG